MPGAPLENEAPIRKVGRISPPSRLQISTT